MFVERKWRALHSPVIVSGRMMDVNQDSRLDSVQFARAVAALMIVVLHAEGLAGRQAAARGLAFQPINGASLEAGVDLFFVISGFIIVFSSERFFAKQGGGAEFLRRRLCRIVPLYWFALTLRVIMLCCMAIAGLTTLPSLAAIATSFAFIPYDALGYGPHHPFPVLDLGWTLNYEVLFYVLFTVVIWMPRLAASLTTIAILLAGVLFVWARPPDSVPLWFWFQPIVLDFAFGIGVALLFRRGVRLGAFSRAGLIAAGLSVWLFLDVSRFDPTVGAVPGFFGWSRFLVYGSAAALVISGAVLGQTEFRGQVLRTLSRLGDSSYALYLLHSFVTAATWLALKPLPLSQAMLWPLVVLSIVISIAAAHVFHVTTERPVVAWLQRRTVNLRASGREARSPVPSNPR